MTQHVILVKNGRFRSTGMMARDESRRKMAPHVRLVRLVKCEGMRPGGFKGYCCVKMVKWKISCSQNWVEH